MNRRPKIAIVWFFAVFLALLAIQTAWPVVPQFGRLAGVAKKTKPVNWTWKAFVSGETAKGVEAWVTEHIGFRNLWVALDNQVSYTFFGETPRRQENATHLVIGAHDWFFEQHYIDTALRNALVSDARIATAVTRLKSVQAKLAKRGIPLLLVVAPSKAEIYPEHIPPAYLRGKSPAQFETTFEKMRPLLKEQGVSYFDGPQRFLDWKAAGQRNLFARSGSHWSNIIAVQVLQEIRGELNATMRRKMPELPGASTPMGRPRLGDADLLDLANLLVAAPYAHDLPEPGIGRQTTVPTGELPRILWVHDSFGWALLQLAYSANLVQPSESLYYYDVRAFGLPAAPEGRPYNIVAARTSVELDAASAKWMQASNASGSVDDRDPRLKPALEQVNWSELLKSYDAVVVIWTEIATDYFSWGLIEQLDRALE